MSPGPWFSGAPRTFLLCGSTVALLACLLGPPWRAVVLLVRPFFVFIIIIIIIIITWLVVFGCLCLFFFCVGCCFPFQFMLGCDALWALLWVIWGCGVAFSALTLTLGCLGGGVSPSGLRHSPGGGWGVVCWGRGGVAAGGGCY